MAGALTENVTVYFDLSASGGAYFTLDDPTKGILDGATYKLGGNIATDVTQYIRSVQIRRGRDTPFSVIVAGVAVSVADNTARTFDPSYATSPYFGNIRPGKRATFTTNGVVRFDGLIDDWNFDYQVSGDSTATFETADALASLGAKEFDAWTSTASQLPGARITSILDRTEVQFPATRNIGTGAASLQADAVSWGSNVLNYAQLIAQCDLGQLFAAKDGTLTFYGADHTLTAVGAPVFSDVAANGIFYSGITIDYGAEQLYNRVSVDAIGFTKQTVSNPDSILLYGERSLSLSNMPLDSEYQAVNLASRILGKYALPVSRIATVTVDLHALSTADQAAVLAVDIGSVIRVAYTPNRISTAVDQFCLVEGVDDLIGPLFHRVTFKLSYISDGYSGSPFMLDDATYGVLDTAGHGVLSL